jgi:hypothetical protein
MMSGSKPRNRLFPWVVGLVIILVAVAYAAWSMLTDSCAEPAMALVAVLFVMPAVYLALMYATLTSQE